MYFAGTGKLNFVGTTVAPPDPSVHSLTIEQAGTNDETGCGVGADCIADQRLALQHIVTHRSSNNVVPAAACSRSGSWGTDSYLPTALTSTSKGSTISCSVTSYGQSAIGISYRAITGNGGTASVTIDGVSAGSLVAQGINGSTILVADEAASGQVTGTVFTSLYPVAAGTHSVTLTVTSNTDVANIVSLLDVIGNVPSAPAPALPLVAVMEILPIEYEFGLNYTNAINDMKSGVVALVSGYGYNVKWFPVRNIPVTNAFDPILFYDNRPGVFDVYGTECLAGSIDNIHPNDCGHDEIAKALAFDLDLIPLHATSSSGLAPVFSLISGPGRVSQSNLVVTAAGTIVVAADQAGSASFGPAAQVTRTIVVDPALQTINFIPPSAPSFFSSATTVELVASGGGSGNPVVFSLAGGPATISNNNLVVTGAGTITIDADQPGNSIYASAPQVQRSFVVSSDYDVVFSGTSTSQTVAPGGASTFAFKITPLGANTLPSTVNLTVSGLPAGAMYTLTPQTVLAGSVTTPVTLTVTAPAAVSALRMGRGMAPFALALLVLPWSRRLRGRKGILQQLATLLLLLCGTVGVAGLVGCGSSASPTAQTFTITVTGTSGALVHASAVTLTVK